MLWKLIVGTSALGLLAGSVRAEEEVILDISQGTIKGTKGATILDEKPLYSFRGIPYTKTIDASNRFEAPHPPESWSGVYDATKEGDECVYMCMIRREIVGDDNCLFVNVYTPEPRVNAGKAVMVWFHGGGFKAGSSDSGLFGPDYLVEQDVVVVTMNYRLGPFGFLNTGDAVAPGNVGLKDQVAALRWVQENIQQFGGSPERVTIFGQSSGGASVQYHMMSPMSEGLFKYAISQSGSAFNPWAFNPNPTELAFELGQKLGIETTNSAVLVEKLATIPSQRIVEASLSLDEMTNSMNGHLFTFVPAVEPMTGSEVFLPASPWELLTAGNVADVPYISGLNLNETLFLKIALQHADEMNKNFVNFVPEDLNVTDIGERRKIADSIKAFYFGDGSLTEDSVNEYTQMTMDLTFTYGVEIPLRIMNSYRSSPIYNYLFTHEAPYGFMKNLDIFNIHEGVVNGDDLGYLFYPRAFRGKPEPGSAEEKIIRLFTKMWTNFAKTGNPTSELDEDVTTNWEPFGNERNYAVIDQTLRMERDMLNERLSFWISLYQNALRDYGNLF